MIPVGPRADVLLLAQVHKWYHIVVAGVTWQDAAHSCKLKLNPGNLVQASVLFADAACLLLFGLTVVCASHLHYNALLRTLHCKHVML